MKTRAAFITVISFCAASVFMQLNAQTQSIEAWYGNGLTILCEFGGMPGPDLHYGGINYRYMDRKLPLGFSTGIAFSGYRNQEGGQMQPNWSQLDVNEQSIFATLPFMMEGTAGKRRVKFTYNFGFALVCSIKSRFSYEGWSAGTYPYAFSTDSAYLNKFQPIQIGVPITGLGIQVDIIKQLYIRVMVENTAYFDVGRPAALSKEMAQYGGAGLGLVDSFLCKVIIGINFRQRTGIVWR